jgi:hypothetical protein
MQNPQSQTLTLELTIGSSCRHGKIKPPPLVVTSRALCRRSGHPHVLRPCWPPVATPHTEAMLPPTQGATMK